MKVVDLLEARRQNWRQLELLCARMEGTAQGSLSAEERTRFAALYRAACADLALADSYQLPPNTVFYLNNLIGRAHNRLYRSGVFKFEQWARVVFFDVPQTLYRDRCLRLAFVLFWGIFFATMFLAGQSRRFANDLLGDNQIELMEEMYKQPINGRDASLNSSMMGFYIWHNTGIGLQFFAFGLLFGIGGLPAVTFNAAVLGGVFGYMTTSPNKAHFFNFVTAHGPFELTAIVLSAAAGMRLGFALVDTRGMTRVASLQRAGRETMPVMGAGIVMFALAALIEGFLSPSAAPYPVKAMVAVVSSFILLFYFVVLGIPREQHRATG